MLSKTSGGRSIRLRARRRRQVLGRADERRPLLVFYVAGGREVPQDIVFAARDVGDRPRGGEGRYHESVWRAAPSMRRRRRAQAGLPKCCCSSTAA